MAQEHHLTVIEGDGPAQEPLANLEAEALLLGALLTENEIIGQVRAVCAIGDFHEPLHQRIYAAILQRHGKGEPVNPALLFPTFKDDPTIKEVGGVTYLAKLTEVGAGLLAARAYAEQLRDLATRRRLRDGLLETLDACSDLATETGEILRRAEGFARGEEYTGASTFALLGIAELEAMPPPAWLIHEAISEDGFSIIYGEPGAGKSFIALDMALRVAAGMDWHGKRTKATGVLYIAAEGARGIGKRVTGWKMHHGIEKLDAPFVVLPVAVQMLDPAQISQLLRTIDEAKRRIGFEVGLVVVDTVSRSIAGEDENKQETMTAFVRACDEIKRHAGGALLGVHHSGKDKERGMRGSSVLLGAVDAAIRVSKSDRLVTLDFEKQKDAEQISPLYFELERREWVTGSEDSPGEEISTLVPIRQKSSDMGEEGISRAHIAAAFTMMAEAWMKGKPLSSKPQTRADGRYAPMVFRQRIGGDAEAWKSLVFSWLDSGAVAFEIADQRTKLAGLKVVDPIV